MSVGVDNILSSKYHDLARCDSEAESDTDVTRMASEVASICSTLSAATVDTLDHDFAHRKWLDRRRQRRGRKGNSGTDGSITYGMMVRRMGSQRLTKNPELDMEDMLSSEGIFVKNLQHIGSGSFAQVHKAILQPDSPALANSALSASREPVAVAVKWLNENNSHDSSSRPKWLKREALVGLQLKHENLVSVFWASVEHAPFALVMELCTGGSLYDVIFDVGDRHVNQPCPRMCVLSWTQRLQILLGISSGLDHLHSKGIIHRDVSSQNMFLAKPLMSLVDRPHIKVGDYGLARNLTLQDGEVHLTRQVGSWYYMAPEAFTANFDPRLQYTGKVDVYSFGMVMYELLTDRLPFTDPTTLASVGSSGTRLGILVTGGIRPDVSVVPSGYTVDLLKSLMERCWMQAPAERPGMAEILGMLELVEVMYSQDDPE